MKKFNQIFLFVFILLFYSANLFAQVNGISNNKLIVPDAGTIEKGIFEFEPSISFFNSSSRFDNNRNVTQLEGTDRVSDLQFRVTLGLLDGFELGTSFSTSLEEIFIGSKVQLFSFGSSSVLTLTGGLSLPTKSNSIDDDVDTFDQRSYSFGPILSTEFSESASMDVMLTFSHYTGNIEYENALDYGIAFGYLLFPSFQAVVELNGYSAFNNSLYSEKLSITPGFTYQFSEKLLYVQGIQFDIIGKNDLRGTNIFSAFTMSF